MFAVAPFLLGASREHFAEGRCPPRPHSINDQKSLTTTARMVECAETDLTLLCQMRSLDILQVLYNMQIHSRCTVQPCTL